MTSIFPSAIQDLDATRGSSTDKMNSEGKDHSLHHQIEDETLEALQNKVGINNSTDTSTIDFMLRGKPSLSTANQSIKGGIKNPSFSGSGTASSSGWITGENYGWYLYKTTTTTSATYLVGGGISLLFTTVGASTNNAYIDNTDNQVAANLSSSNKFIPLDISSKYRFSIEYDVRGNSGGSLKATIQQQNGDGTNIDNSIIISGNTTRKTDYIEFTASKKYGRIMIGYFGGTVPTDGTSINIYKVSLQRIVETQTDNLIDNTQSISTFQSIGSTDNIDQSLDTTGIYTNSYTLLTAINEGTTYRQTYIPTKTKQSKIGIYITNKGTGDWTLTVHDSSNVCVSSQTITNANLSAGWNYFNVPCILTTGNSYHFHVISTVADGIIKVQTSADLETCSFIQQFYKPTTGISVYEHNQKLSVNTDEDGLLEGAIIDLQNGIYSFNSGYNQTQGSLVNMAKIFYSASAAGGNTGAVINGLNTDGPSYGFYCVSACTVTIKVNLPTNGKSISIDWQSYKWAAGNRNLKISFDNSTYITIDTHNLANMLQRTTATYDITGKKVIYIQFDNPGSNNFSLYNIQATLDTSMLNILYNKPTNKDLYQIYIKTLTSSTSTATYRAIKFGFPSIEFGNGEYTYLDTDTINANYVKLSTDGINYSTMSDGSSIGISSTNLPIIFASYNIPSNRIYISSNDTNSNIAKPGSLETNISYITRLQGIKYDIQDIQNKINELTNAVKVLQNN